MPGLLHIQASPMGQRSFSARLASAFLESYSHSHPDDHIEVLDLWQRPLPEFDSLAAAGKYKVMRNLPHTAEEAAAWQRVRDLVDHFLAFDRYLLSSPMWNFSIPYRLKHYIDVLVQPGLTFAYSPDSGYRGLVTGRPICLLLARGGAYPPGTDAASMDFQRPYLERIFRFIGFEDIRTLVVESTTGPDAEARLAEATAQARQFAERL